MEGRTLDQLTLVHTPGMLGEGNCWSRCFCHTVIESTGVHTLVDFPRVEGSAVLRSFRVCEGQEAFRGRFGALYTTQCLVAARIAREKKPALPTVWDEAAWSEIEREDQSAHPSLFELSACEETKSALPRKYMQWVNERCATLGCCITCIDWHDSPSMRDRFCECDCHDPFPWEPSAAFIESASTADGLPVEAFAVRSEALLGPAVEGFASPALDRSSVVALAATGSKLCAECGKPIDGHGMAHIFQDDLPGAAFVESPSTEPSSAAGAASEGFPGIRPMLREALRDGLESQHQAQGLEREKAPRTCAECGMPIDGYHIERIFQL